MRTNTTSIVSALRLTAVASLAMCCATSASAQPGERIEYRNPRFGFALSIPGDVFQQGETRNAEAGNLWVSHDGQARLIAGAQANEGGESLQSYRRYIMETTYAGASFDYTPMRDTWFVLSGMKDGQMFYERVTFACGGRYIYGWQIMYPATDRRRWDRIVEQVHRSYRPGRGEDGNCG